MGAFLKTVIPSELFQLLLNIATVRPVFIWGPPGVGKTAIVNQFGEALGMEVVSLLGSQLAPEDLIGVPRITDNFSVFVPPRQIAGHTRGVILFIDEFNASSPEVQKAFYSLVTEQRLGEYQLPAGSVVILAGNRNIDNAITRQVSSALMNRVVSVELKANARDWLLWAYGVGLHEFVLKYIETRPDHLSSPPPKTEEPFSSPRSWHILSDSLQAYKGDLTPAIAGLLAEGTISAAHAHNFTGFVRGLMDRLRVDDIIDGSAKLPLDPEQRDVLTFVVQAIRAQLTKELPANRANLSPAQKQKLHNIRTLISQLAEHDEEMVILLLAKEDGEGARNYPTWFLVEISTSLGKLAQKLHLTEEK
jgi:hypothetical protein